VQQFTAGAFCLRSAVSMRCVDALREFTVSMRGDPAMAVAAVLLRFLRF
jgi:hypothetical protein